MLRNLRYPMMLLFVLACLMTAGWALAQDGEAAASGTPVLLTALRHTHSLVRWIVIVIAVAALVKLALGLTQGSAYDRLARGLMLGLAGSITLQWVIGLAFLIVLGGLTGFGLAHYWLHLVVMTVALGLAHSFNRWKKAEDATRYRTSLGVLVGVLVLVFIGVALLPQGWRLFPPV